MATNWKHFQKVFFQISAVLRKSLLAEQRPGGGCPAGVFSRPYWFEFFFFYGIDLQQLTPLGCTSWNWQRCFWAMIAKIVTPRLCCWTESSGSCSVSYYIVEQLFFGRRWSHGFVMLRQAVTLPAAKDPLQIQKAWSSLTWETNLSTHSLCMFAGLGSSTDRVTTRLMASAHRIWEFGKPPDCSTLHLANMNSEPFHLEFRWPGTPAQTWFAGQQIENTSRRSFSKSQQSWTNFICRAIQIENTSRRSFSESE